MNKKVITILGLAFVLRLITIDQSFWLDEATSGIVVRDLSFNEILTKFSPADFHPPLYYLILKIWSTIFGTSEIALRLLSVIFGTATVIVVYKIAQNLVKERYAVIASLLMATAPLHIYYSQEARMYSMAALFASLSVYFFILLSKKHDVKYALFTGITLDLAMLSDYVAVFMLPVILLAGLTSKNLRNKTTFMYLSSPLIICGILVLPLFLQQFSNALGVKESGSLWWNILGEFSLKNILLVPIKLVIGRIGFENNLVYAAYAGLALISYGLVIAIAQVKNKTLYLWLLVPYVLSILVSLFIPILYYFRLLFILPALYILASIGISKSTKYANVLVMLLLSINLVSIGIFYVNSQFHREDWRGLVAHIPNYPGSQVVFVASSQMEAFDYYNNSKLQRVSPENIDLQSDKIWLMRYVRDIYDPADTTRSLIEKAGFYKVNELDFNGVVVWEYENSN